MKVRTFISFILLCVMPFMFTSCTEKQDTGSAASGLSQDKSADDRYIVFFLTNTSVDQADGKNEGRNANTSYTFVGELPQLFGKIKAENNHKYAFGLPGPMLLTQSAEEMQTQVKKAFKLAEKYNVPVYFQLDDCNNYTTEFGNGVETKFYENPDWCEWTSFPAAGENWGGEANGRLPHFWFNWGDWRYSPAFPCFDSKGFRKFVVKQMTEGVLNPLNKWYSKMKKQGKEYLFAGMAIGWETHIPDYSASNKLLSINPNKLPKSITDAEHMQPWEASEYGYHDLALRGFDKYNREALYQSIHDYSELLARTAFKSGIPKNKIFTHIVGYKSANTHIETTFTPPIWTAVNPYSTPGFTMSQETCPYNLDILTNEIKKADSRQTHFANAEGYARGVNSSYEKASQYFESMFSKGALMVSVYGWGREAPTSAFAVSHSPTDPFVEAARDWISGK